MNSEGFSALTTQAALDSLFDSLQRNKEFQLKQICDLSLNIDGHNDAFHVVSKQDLIESGERISVGAYDLTCRFRIHIHAYIHTTLFDSFCINILVYK